MSPTIHPAIHPENLLGSRCCCASFIPSITLEFCLCPPKKKLCTFTAVRLLRVLFLRCSIFLSPDCCIWLWLYSLVLWLLVIVVFSYKSCSACLYVIASFYCCFYCKYSPPIQFNSPLSVCPPVLSLRRIHSQLWNQETKPAKPCMLCCNNLAFCLNQ